MTYNNRARRHWRDRSYRYPSAPRQAEIECGGGLTCCVLQIQGESPSKPVTVVEVDVRKVIG